MKYLRITHVLILLCLLSTPGQTEPNKKLNQNWNFQVFLDDKPIGQHSFELRANDQLTQITGKARFNVKLLGFTVYTYQHDNLEQWQDGCLRQINTATNDNGEALSVRGAFSNQQFTVQTKTERHQYPACVRTFAYWNPDYLRGGQLLNGQTGELVATRFTDLGTTTLTHPDKEPVNARHYRLTGKNINIELWYSADNQWLALESVTPEGRRIRYQLP